MIKDFDGSRSCPAVSSPRRGARWAASVLLLAVSVLPAPAAEAQEAEISFYTGAQTAQDSSVDFTDALGVSTSFNASWEGLSGELPPYYGFRYTRWVTESVGWGVEFTHAKVYADNATLAASGFSTLEMTDGLNLLTVNAWRRWQNDSDWTPYVGIGVGVAVPHVEARTPLGNRTFEYQVTGPAARLVLGVSYEINDRWSVFGEYNGTYSTHDINLVGGGSMQTDIVTHAINIGLTYRF